MEGAKPCEPPPSFSSPSRPLGLPVPDLAARKPQQWPYKAGDFVVVIRQSELKVENKAVDTVEPGVLMGVDQVQGDWLWVTKQKSGWFSSANVIPAEKSVEYFTAAIRRNPTDAQARLLVEALPAP